VRTSHKGKKEEGRKYRRHPIRISLLLLYRYDRGKKEKEKGKRKKGGGGIIMLGGERLANGANRLGLIPARVLVKVRDGKRGNSSRKEGR